MRKLLLSLLTLSSCCPAIASAVYSNAYATTNVTTSAYVPLVASTPVHVASLLVCDTSGHLIKIAVGAAGYEVDLATAPYNSCMILPIGPVLKLGSRISLKAIDATASSGYLTMSFVQ